MWFRRCSIMLFLLCFSVNATENLLFSAFGTLGLTLSDSDHYGYRKDISYDEGVFSGDVNFLNNSLLGVQLDYRFNNDIDFVGQAVARDMPISSFDRYITLAFMRYSPSANWSFRIGRTAPDIFLITEYRDIDIAYTWATPPSEVYGMVPYRHLDGADASYHLRVGEGMLTSTFFAGISEGEIASGQVGPSESPITSIETLELDKILGFSMTYDMTNWTFQAKHTVSRIGNESNSNEYFMELVKSMPDELWPNSHEFASSLALKGKEVKYTSVSSQGYVDNWVLSAELGRTSSNSIEIPTIMSGYVSAAYQYLDHAFYGVYSASTSDLYSFNEPGVAVDLIPEIIFAVEQTVNFYAPKQQTISLGWRWDFDTNIAASLQWNHTNIDDGGSTLWINSGYDYGGDSVNTVFASVSFSL